jgi:hemolysin III
MRIENKISPRGRTESYYNVSSMTKAHTTSEYTQTLGEEIANSVSHGVALVLAIAAVPVLIVVAARAGDAWNIAGASVFAITVVLLYLASTLYHALPPNKAKQVFRVLDHGAIFLLIAGTYTPFTLGVMRGPWGWTLFGLVWSLAILGIGMKAVFGARHIWLSVILYLTMGWLVLIAAPQVWQRVPLSGLLWLLAGGVAYTAGVAVFAAHRVRYSHLAWHLFVVTGTICHFFAVLWYST